MKNASNTLNTFFLCLLFFLKMNHYKAQETYYQQLMLRYNWQTDQLKGKVKSFVQTLKIFKNEANNPIENYPDIFILLKYQKILKEFEPSGNLKLEFRYSKEDSMKSEILNQPPNRFTVFNSSNDKDFNGKNEYLTDDNGNVIEMKTYYPIDSLMNIFQMKYNSHNQMIYTCIKASNGELLSSTDNIIDANSSLIEQKNVDYKNKYLWHSYYINDTAQNVILEMQYHLDYKDIDFSLDSSSREELNQYIKYEYDTNHNLIKNSRFNTDSDIPMDFIAYEYDNHENIIEEIFNSSYNEISRRFMYKYTYDFIGNWTSKSIFEENELIAKIERVFEYY